MTEGGAVVAGKRVGAATDGARSEATARQGVGRGSSRSHVAAEPRKASSARSPSPMSARRGSHGKGASGAGKAGADKTCPDVFTMDEVFAHRTRGDCWVVVDNKVYDVSDFLGDHPGGERVILSVAGTDASDQFAIYHPQGMEKWLKTFEIGRLDTPTSISPALQEYRDLRDALEKDGSMETNPWWYIREAIRLSAILAAAIGTALYAPADWARVVVGGVLLGLFFQQTAFVGHDLGHSGVTHASVNKVGLTHWNDHLLGLLVGNVLTGIDIGWWKNTHYVHHSVTNSVTGDPDVQHVPVFAIDESFFRSLFSDYHGRVMTFDNIARVLVARQHILYWPIMCFARVNLYIQSFIFLLKAPEVRTPVLQWAGLAIFWTWLIALLTTFPTWYEAFAFFLISHAVAGVLHVQITLSHFGMTCYDGCPTAPVLADRSEEEEPLVSVSPSLSPAASPAVAPSGKVSPLLSAADAPDGASTSSAGSSLSTATGDAAKSAASTDSGFDSSSVVPTAPVSAPIPGVDGEPGLAEAPAPDFFRAQLGTTLDVVCSPWLDWVHGGLQFQAIHHLFPRLPRHNLRRVSQDVARICERHSITYHRMSFWQANVRVYRALKRTADKAHTIDPIFWDSINAQG